MSAADPPPAEIERIDARGGSTGIDITGAPTVRSTMATGGFAGMSVTVPSGTASLHNVTAVGGMRGLITTRNGTIALDSTIARALAGGTDIRATVGTVTATHSNYETTSASGATIADPTTNSNQTAAPQLIDMTNADVFARDLNERFASPTVDAGSGATTFDIDDQSAIGTRDIGADERGDADVEVAVSHGSLAFPSGTRTFNLRIRNDTFFDFARGVVVSLNVPPGATIDSVEIDPAVPGTYTGDAIRFSQIRAIAATVKVTLSFASPQDGVLAFTASTQTRDTIRQRRRAGGAAQPGRALRLGRRRSSSSYAEPAPCNLLAGLDGALDGDTLTLAPGDYGGEDERILRILRDLRRDLLIRGSVTGTRRPVLWLQGVNGRGMRVEGALTLRDLECAARGSAWPTTDR